MLQDKKFDSNVFGNFNLLSSTSNNLDKNIFDDSKEKFNFDNAYKSVNIPKYYFTNYLDSKKSNFYKFIRRQSKLMLNANYSIFDNFELKDVNYGANLKKEKIEQIVFETRAIKRECNLIYRFKNNLNPAFQLYVDKVDNNNYDVLIIDLYHLVIPAADKYYGKKVADLKADYDKVKNNSICLSEIKNS